MLSNIFNFKLNAFGLDISDKSLKLVKIQEKRNKKKIVSYNKISLPEGIIKGGEVKDPPKLSKFVKKLLKEVKGDKISSPYVVASLPEEKTFSQIISLPKMSEQEAKQAIYFEAEKYIPYSVDDVYLDCQKVDVKGGEKERTYVLLVALPKKTIDQCVDSLKLAGLKPLALEVESQSLMRAILDESEKEFPPLLALDIGITRTGFVIFSGRTLRFTTSISVSSGNFTKAISKSLKVSLKEAEELKIKYGLSRKTKKAKEVFEAIVPAITDLVEQIRKYIDYYYLRVQKDKNSLGNVQIKKILLSGGGAKLKNIKSFLEEELKLPTELANPLVNINSTFHFPKSRSLEYANAIGLALRALKEDELY